MRKNFLRVARGCREIPLEEEEAKLKGEVKLLEEDLGLVFALQSDRSYSILLRRNRLLIAAISVQFARLFL